MAFLWKSNNRSVAQQAEFHIPKQVHFLWGFLGDAGPLPNREQRNHELWQGKNPTWNCQVQTPDRIEQIFSTRPKDHRDTNIYRELPTAIQRCDVARPLILKEVGGIYSDLDVHPHRDMDWLCGLYPRAKVLLVEEVTLTRGSSIRRGNRFPVRQGNPELRLRVANFWMASAPGHPFWDDVMDLVDERRKIEIKNDYDVIYTTGPDIISEVYHRKADQYDDVALIPRKIARRFFRHRTHGSWRTEGKDSKWVA